ncbi:MAG: MraY family glycosyltransferase [Betaproteobacteria bacterium]
MSRLALDHPNERSLHQLPIPRTGGVAIQAGIGLAWWMAAPGLPLLLVVAWCVLVLVSFYDDMRGLPAAARLAVHLIAALAVATDGIAAQHGHLAAFLTAVLIAWMTNLYNFMDGADGLAGGMTLLGFSFYGVAAWLAGDAPLAIISASVAAAAAAFLAFNLHPARLFMGDVGSVPLGFLAGSLGLCGWLRGHWEWWFPLLVFSPFVVDATVTLGRRLARRERIWVAHRDHYYQRLVQLGWGHRKTAWAEYALMAACGLAGLATSGRAPVFQAAMLAAMALIYVMLIAAISRAWRARRSASAR